VIIKKQGVVAQYGHCQTNLTKSKVRLERRTSLFKNKKLKSRRGVNVTQGAANGYKFQGNFKELRRNTIMQPNDITGQIQHVESFKCY
jgi:hypothetical protein